MQLLKWCLVNSMQVHACCSVHFMDTIHKVLTYGISYSGAHAFALCIYVHTSCTCTCIYMCVHVYVHVCTWIHVVHVHIYTCTINTLGQDYQ